MRHSHLLTALSFVAAAASAESMRNLQNDGQPRSSASQVTPARARQPGRKVASVPASKNRVYVTRGQTLREPIFSGRIGLVGGISNVSAGTSSTEEARGTEGIRQNITLGGMADVRALKYLGAEIDVFFGLAPKREIKSEEFDGGTLSSSLQQSGGLFAIKGQLPLGAFVPKIGLGYGFASLKHSLADETFTQKSELRISAPFALLGFDWSVGRSLIFGADYARSLGGGGSYKIEADGFDGTSSKLGGALYDRIRVSGYWRFTPGFLGGAQFIRRFIETDFSGLGGSTPSNQEVLSQILAIAAFEF